jgi:hypothetical protein
MQTYLPTLRMIESSSSGEVTSTDTHKFVFLATIIDSSRLARALCVLAARFSYEVICPVIGAVGVIRDKTKKISPSCWQGIAKAGQLSVRFIDQSDLKQIISQARAHHLLVDTVWFDEDLGNR